MVNCPPQKKVRARGECLGGGGGWCIGWWCRQSRDGEEGLLRPQLWGHALGPPLCTLMLVDAQ